MFKTITLIAGLFWLSTSALHAQKRSYFAVGILSGANSTVVTYAIVTKIGDQFLGTQLLDEQYFMYFALGHWPSKANARRENLFEKYKVPNCGLEYNASGKVVGYSNTPFQELWKIKYKAHPQRRDAAEGWSQDYYKPSAAQARYLHKTYNVLNINTHYFIGDYLFQLLRDVQDPDWIAMYRSLSE